jgi:amino acid adenylation domain-containing protein
MEGHDVLHAFAAAVAQGPARIAVDAGTRRLSYLDLDAWTGDLAATLRRGAPRGVVAVAAEDPLHRVAALLGTLRAGCVFAPVDLDQPPARLRALLERLAPQWILGAPGCSAAVAARTGWAGAARGCHLDFDRLAAVEEGAAPIPGVPGVPGVPAVARSAAPPADAAAAGSAEILPALAGAVAPPESPPVLAPDDLCYIVQTSGSTGTPKSIAGRYRAIGQFIRWENDLLGLTPGTRVSQLTSPHFDAYLRDIFAPLTCGGTVCIPPAAELRLDGAALARWIDASAIELIHCVPSLFHLLAAGDGGDLHPRLFPRLRWVLLAGEAPLQADLARWFAVFGRRVRFLNLYGPSETTMTKLFHEIAPEDLERRSIPVGRPIPGAAVLLADRRGRVCAPGTVGEIVLRTPHRSLGYLGEPGLTAEVFVPNPWRDGHDPADLVYRTGDLGRQLPDGAIELLGRRDQQLKIRGQRIEPGEIESVLGEHPQVQAAAVVARPDSAGLPALCAFVVTREEVAPQALRDWVARRLPPALVPDRFVSLPVLPLLGNGKIDRRALATAELAAARREPRVAARTPTELRLAAIWGEVIETRDAGIRDDFFASGGHSLLAARLLLRVRQAFGVEVPLAAFFDRPTIEALAEEVEERLLSQVDPLLLEEALREIDATPSAAAASAGGERSGD